ncbi:hypothetical protein [Streptomyces flaveus]|uniref:Uncharacterized protein n=1 Tax=Streptomyces flaveus TaxID=66370 RepID=A0A917RRJ0_9ACTN|nr:hypothetical protein [Streptomyces flaveus]GGL18746.1 hypothetical protein GCM10010094_94830 [Streptomyces flaveus]
MGIGTVGLAAVCAVVARGLVMSTVTGRALQTDHAVRVGVLFAFEEERGAGRDQLGERFVVTDFAYGCVVQACGGMDEGV